MAFVEDFYDILQRIHAKELGHFGYKKTLAEVAKYASYVVKFNY